MEFFPLLIPTQMVLKLPEVLKFIPKSDITHYEVCFTPVCLQRFVQYLTLESLQKMMLAFVKKPVICSAPAFFFCLSLLPF